MHVVEKLVGASFTTSQRRVIINKRLSFFFFLSCTHAYIHRHIHTYAYTYTHIYTLYITFYYILSFVLFRIYYVITLFRKFSLSLSLLLSLTHMYVLAWCSCRALSHLLSFISLTAYDNRSSKLSSFSLLGF